MIAEHMSVISQGSWRS